MCVFFFKQKTAYEMRISDWSSDVCSSDLDVLAAALAARRQRLGQVQRGREAVDDGADDDNAAAVGKRHGGLLQERRFGSSIRRDMRSRRKIGASDSPSSAGVMEGKITQEKDRRGRLLAIREQTGDWVREPMQVVRRA